MPLRSRKGKSQGLLPPKELHWISGIKPNPSILCRIPSSGPPLQRLALAISGIGYQIGQRRRARFRVAGFQGDQDAFMEACDGLTVTQNSSSLSAGFRCDPSSHRILSRWSPVRFAAFAGDCAASRLRASRMVGRETLNQADANTHRGISITRNADGRDQTDASCHNCSQQQDINAKR
jgi:hypothetical protein